MNIGMDGMILMGAFFGVLGSWLFASAAAGVALAVGVGLLVGLFFALFVVKLRSDEFIIGCALNTFALGLTGFLSRSIFGASGTKEQRLPAQPAPSGHREHPLPRQNSQRQLAVRLSDAAVRAAAVAVPL